LQSAAPQSPTKKDIFLVLKKSTLLKLFVKARLIDVGGELNEFETQIINKYGAGKHSFTLDDINEVMVLYGTLFFPNECNLDARLLISSIFKISIIPHTEYCLTNPKVKPNKNNDQKNLVKLL
jgi:hypothetical protein